MPLPYHFNELRGKAKDGGDPIEKRLLGAIEVPVRQRDGEQDLQHLDKNRGTPAEDGVELLRVFLEALRSLLRLVVESCNGSLIHLARRKHRAKYANLCLSNHAIRLCELRRERNDSRGEHGLVGKTVGILIPPQGPSAAGGFVEQVVAREHANQRTDRPADHEAGHTADNLAQYTHSQTLPPFASMLPTRSIANCQATRPEIAPRAWRQAIARRRNSSSEIETPNASA